MSITRRSMLAGLGATIATPAWAQAIAPQSDPWAQVDPYDDPRNGFSSERRAAGDGAAAAPPRPASAAGAGNPAGVPDDEAEIAVGRAAYPHWIKEAGGPVADARLQQALRDFCKPLFAAADRPSLPWTVTLTNQREPNASAGPGGMVIVHAGMVALVDSPYDLAGVMAHEVGHVDLRHASRGVDMARLAQVAREQGAASLGDQAMAQLMPEVKGAVPDFMALMRLSFSREDEAEADAHAVRLFARLGIDPALAAGGMRTILKLESLTGGGAPSEWVTEHPLTPDRVRAMEQLAATLSKPAANFVFPGWDRLKAAYPTPPAFRKA